MPVPAWMSVEGKESKTISKEAGSPESIGKLSRPEHKDEILVWSFDYTVTQPTDHASGEATGTRVHGVAKITKMFDKSSPLLFKALTTAELLTEVVFKFFRIEGAAETHYYTITLENARVTEFNAWMPNFQDPSQAHLQQMENVSFRFTSITLEFLDGGIRHTDSWG